MRNVLYILCMVLPIGMYEIIIHGIVELVVTYMQPLGYSNDYMAGVSMSLIRTFYFVWYGMMGLWSIKLIFKEAA